MQSEPGVASNHEVEAKLKLLRDVPVNTAGTQDKDILLLLTRLMRVKPGSDNRIHWFCPLADNPTRETATFLLRLHAYSNDKVNEWRRRIKQVWRGCADCIRGMDEAKSTSRSTYFGAFSDVILERFWISFEIYEIQSITEALTEANITPDSSKSLADVSSPVLYHILSKPSAFANSFILGVISSEPFLPHAIDWPIDPPPLGYFLLVVHETKEIRDWAVQHVGKANPMVYKQFNSAYELTLQLIMKHAAVETQSTLPESLITIESEINLVFPFAKAQKIAWAGLGSILRLIPPEVYNSFGVHRIVMSHLHDSGPHFREVLLCMLQTTTKLGSSLWSGEGTNYPQVVLDSIKDNASYTDLILDHDARKEPPWFLHFFREYLRSVWELPVFENVIAKYAAFTCDELQHERFENRRSLVTSIAMQTMSAALTRAGKLKSQPHRQVILNVLDIHFDFIVAVASSSEYAGIQWGDARSAAVSLIRTVLTTDVEQLANAVVALCAIQTRIPKDELKRLIPEVRRQVWCKIYANANNKDLERISMLLELAARLAKFDNLSKKVLSRMIRKLYEEKAPQDLLETLDSTIDSVNSSLTIIRDGFLDIVTKFAYHNTSSFLKNAIQQGDLSKHLVVLMLSPVEELHVAAQTFISQAYDVDIRADCLRAILKRMPESSLKGIYQYISEFNAYAMQVTEACDTSKALVRCMTDVIEVLANSPDGLLKDPAYVRRNLTANFSFKTELPKLWQAMARSVAVIFKRTAKWASYFDNAMMTEWMRDALIFARDLIDRRGAIEVATLVVEDVDIISSPRKASSIGKKMVEDLQDVFLELQAWLRLTDTELLYQSLALLKSLFRCFRSADVRPSAEALSRLSRFIELSKSTKDSKRVSYLSQADLAELEVAAADFDEDEVEVISVGWKSKGKRRIFERSSSPEVVDIDELIQKRQKAEDGTIASSSKGALKNTVRARLPSSRKPSRQMPVQKPLRIQEKPTIRPVASTIARREPKFEGSYGPVRPVVKQPTSPPSPSSSSSESEAEEAPDEHDLVTIQMRKKKPEIKEAKQPVERRKIKVIEDPKLRQARLEAEERRRQVEAARRDAMRLKPDITSLHAIILAWNYDHDSSNPPMDQQRLAPVPDSFRSHEEYMRIFRPLLLLEAWSQIVKSKEETRPDIVQVNIGARSVTHPWLDLDTSLQDLPRFDWRLTPETDIVSLRHIRAKHLSIMAKVTYFRKTNDGVAFGLRCCTRALKGDPGLAIGSTWELQLVFSLTTLHREYAALMALPYYDMKDVILSPRLSDPVIVSDVEVRETMQAYKVNEPQAKAIISAMRTKGFSLIQGPPGTGKTWTICGLVGAFLSSRRTVATPIAIPGRAAAPAQKAPVQKLLVCAPSNAAIDEVTKRLIQDVRGSGGQRLTPKVVRVGSEAQINVSAKEFSLDSLVEARVSADGGNLFGDAAAEATSLRGEIEGVKEARQQKLVELQKTINNVSKTLSLEHEVNVLNAKRMTLSQQLDRLRDKQKSQNRAADAIRRRYRYEILSEADIICSTLSGAGHEQLESFDFSMVIIDEAAQSIELSSLIPLKYQCDRCVMVGDPQQLPPTVLSPEAAKWGYDQSLFVRLQKHRPNAIHLLSIQYRMHPEISLLPSKVFYDGRLQDGPEMDKKTAQPWHVEPRFRPYKFYSVEDGREEASRVGHSLFNMVECRMIAAFYDRLRKEFSTITFDYRIGIVSMYRAQVQELRNLFRQRFGRDIIAKVDFNTVDGFQGQEKDIIILSCVRAGTSLATVGFLADIRRMNVAITRSRSSLFIFGHAPTLQRSNKIWKDIIDDARSRSCFTELRDLSYFASGGNSTKTQTTAERDSTAPRGRRPSAKAVGASQNDPEPEPELFSPKTVKGPTSRKLPKGTKFVGMGNANNAASGSQCEEQTTLQGYPSGGQDPAPGGSDAGVKPSGMEASTKQTIPQPARRPPDLINRIAGLEVAQKELEAFRRRKKEANNPFIKR